MASRTIKLTNIKPGTYMSWFATTQACFKNTMTLKDDKKTYFKATRQSTNIEPPMAQGSARYVGKDLTLIIDIPQAKEEDLKVFLNTFTLLTPAGDEAGYSFTVCGEDYIDNDFNDFYLTVMAWNSEGGGKNVAESGEVPS